MGRGATTTESPPPGRQGAKGAGYGMGVFLFWVVPIILSGLVWKSKGGQSGIGGLFGLFLGWIGVLIALAATPKEGRREKCPFCKELVKIDASVCPHCQRDIKSSERFRSVTKQKTWEADGKTWVVGSDGRTYYLENGEWVPVEATSPQESGSPSP